MGWRAISRLVPAALTAGIALSFRHPTVGFVLSATAFSFAAAIPYAFFFFGGYFGWTSTDSKGIHTWSTVIRRTVRWHDVALLTVVDAQDKGIVHIAQVERRDGTAVKLYGVMATRRSDPKFNSDLKAIRADWETATGRIAAQV